jgi:Na+/H+-dicarboxylate symporter
LVGKAGFAMKKRTIIVISSLIFLAIVIAYVVIQVFTPGTVLYVEPQATSKSIDQDFAVNITISNVADLYAWQFKLTWNTAILDLVPPNVTEGPFLKSGGTTIWNPEINSTIGYVFAVCSLTGSETPGVSGNGVLATVYFHVKGSGSCDLDLSEITLYNSAEKQITNRIVDGQFHT